MRRLSSICLRGCNMAENNEGAAINLERFTNSELLVHVDAAIQNILVGGQSYKLGSRSLTRADLGLLRQMRNELLAQENTGDGCLQDLGEVDAHRCGPVVEPGGNGEGLLYGSGLLVLVDGAGHQGGEPILRGDSPYVRGLCKRFALLQQSEHISS